MPFMPCCQDVELPEVLFASVQIGCLVNGQAVTIFDSVRLPYDAGTGRWTGEKTLICGDKLTLSFYCLNSQHKLDWAIEQGPCITNPASGSAQLVTSDCTEVKFSFQASVGWVSGCGCCNNFPGVVLFTITPLPGRIGIVPATDPATSGNPSAGNAGGGRGAGAGGRGATSCGEQCSAQRCSSEPVRYATGEVVVEAADLMTDGFGTAWGHTRSFANRLTPNENVGNGYNWQVREWTYLVVQEDGTVCVMGWANNALWFDKVGEAYVPRFSVRDTLLFDTGRNVYRLVALDGSVTEYDGITGGFLGQTDVAGNSIQVISMAENGFDFTEVQRSATIDGQTTTESFLYGYVDPTAAFPILSSVTLRRKVDGGAWENVRKAVYTYYGANDVFGGLNDLQTVLTRTWDGSAWEDTGTTLYRYYKTLSGSSSSSSSSSSSGAAPATLAHLLKYVVNPASYEKLAADPNVTDPLTTSDAIVSLYADNYFEYDSSRRVTKEIVESGSQIFTYEFSQSAFDDGYNAWKTKTVETLPDGNQNIIYSNFAGQTMLSVFQSDEDQWCEFRKYDEGGKEILHAMPSAVSGFDEQYADLLHEVDGNYEFLKDNEGLIHTYAYHVPTGWLTAEKIQEGELGQCIKLREMEYISCCTSSSSSSSSNSSSSSSGSAQNVPCRYFLSKVTEYPEDGLPDGSSSSSSSSCSCGAGEGCCSNECTRKIVTTYDYTFYPGTCALQQKTTTLPVIPESQNGSGVAATRKDYFDTYGNLIWAMDERGFITRLKYDIPTGALTQRIDDVDTEEVDDAPVGWETPASGGLHLITDYAHDDQGRITQTLGPAHAIDLEGVATEVRTASWMVYQDADFETWSAQGYQETSDDSFTLVNPVGITKTDKQGRVLEQIAAVRGSEVTSAGKLEASDSFPQSSYVRWTTTQYTDCCFVASRRVYHAIPASGPGTEGTNYDETDFGYDVMKRQNRTVTPGGTITQTVFNSRGLPVSTWVGTDDTGSTAENPAGSGPPNNMVQVSATEYDNDADGGDGNVTKQTALVDSDSDNDRVTTFLYDFRNRRIATDGEVEFYEKTTYDNLNRMVKSERFNTTAGGNLIARSETKHDDRRRVFQTIRYAVDPVTGTVGNELTDNTWFDAVGNVIKAQPAGAMAFGKVQYDGLNRPIKRFVGYDLSESSYSDANEVSGDTVMAQTESTYDEAGAVIKSVNRQRYHNATGTGELTSPSGEQPKARVTYMAAYPDGVSRLVATADYGTNGGTALSRPDTIPASSDTCLVSTTEHNARGDTEDAIDPAGMKICFDYDDMGRRIQQILNCQNGSSSSSSSSSSGGCAQSDDQNVTTYFAFNADGNSSSLTAQNARTGNQVTTYLFGTTLDDSAIASSLLKIAEVYPDAVDETDRKSFTYNRQGEIVTATDQNETVHTLEYDRLGRPTQDRVTTLGSGVDGAVRRIGVVYEVRGLPEKITTYDNAAAGSGNIVNEVQRVYNAFGQPVTEYQSHSGAVNTSTTPKVQYDYADGSANTVRLMSMIYPNGRVLHYDYGSAGSMADALSRIASIIDDDGTTHLADYSYLGESAIIEVDLTEPDVKYTLIGTAGGDDPDTGDIYRGLDRFGRVKDLLWREYGSSVDIVRIKHGYDRAGNRLWREDPVAAANGKSFDELYTYDGIHRLKSMIRGTLNGSKTAITSPTFAQCWGLDATGNWSDFRQDDDGDTVWNLIQSRTTNKVNEITDVSESVGPSWATPVYDRNGNMTTIPKPADPTGNFTGTYDAWNNLVKLTEGANAVAEFQHDGINRRVVKKTYVGGSLDKTHHSFISLQWQTLEARIDASSNPDRQFIWGLRYVDDLILRDRDPNDDSSLDERLYALQDPNWNMTGIVDTNAVVQERYGYDAYGAPAFMTSAFNPRASSLFDWETLFGGNHRDSETGCLSIRNRILRVNLGWMQRDPLGIKAGTNLYEYVHSDPINRVDPDGLQEFRGPGGTIYNPGVPKALPTVPAPSPSIRIPPVPSCACFDVSPELADLLKCMRDAVLKYYESGGRNACFEFRDRAQNCKSNDYDIIDTGGVINVWGPAVNPIWGNPPNYISDAGIFICDRDDRGCLYVNFVPWPGSPPEMQITCYDPKKYVFPQPRIGEQIGPTWWNDPCYLFGKFPKT